MEQQDYDKLIENVERLKKFDVKSTRHLNLQQLDRVSLRLKEFSPNCIECEKNAQELLEITNELVERQGKSDNKILKAYTMKVNSILGHLNKEHKLVGPGHYMSMYMMFGIALGSVYTLLPFNNTALGISIGMCIGLAIGLSVDADAKKKGRQI